MIYKQTPSPSRNQGALGPASLGPVNCHSWSCLFLKFFCQVSMGAEGSLSPFSKSRVSWGLELASPLKSFSKETWAGRPCGWQRGVWLSEALPGFLGGQLPGASQHVLRACCKGAARTHHPAPGPPRTQERFCFTVPGLWWGECTDFLLWARGQDRVLRPRQSNLVGFFFFR